MDVDRLVEVERAVGSFLRILVVPREEDEEWVQDCPVCCHPWKIRVKYRRDGTADVTVGAEGE